MEVVFTFSFDSWGVSSARGNFSSDVLSQDLIHGDRVDQLIVADAYRSVFGVMKRLLMRRTTGFPTTARASLVTPLRLPRHEPTKPSAMRSLYARYVRRLEASARARGLTRPVLLTTHPFIAAAATSPYWRHVTYYGWDDWAAHPTYAAYRATVLDAYASIAANGHRVVGVSQRIVDRIGSPGLSVVVPNGLIADEWTEPVPAPQWFVELPRPRLLYTGSIDGRIDHDYIRQAAAAFPEGSLVIVGKVEDPAAVASLRGLPNVHFIPRQPREIIRGVTFAADVALIPHVVTDLTQSMSPLKMYEYLAAGRPVVATDLEPVRRVPHVRRVDNAAAFVEQIQLALLDPEVSEQERLAFVQANSWTARLDRLYNAAL